ncbi:MAG TPA: hypothetical protein VKV15_10665 [Bryobacteraceae bacterium]|nr:hypothetical protein [Bryobacteraceae bacterium]
MASISPADLARELLECCLAGARWRAAALKELVAMAAGQDAELAREASLALFGILIERLGDLFEPRLCDVYADLFSQVIEQVRPEFRAANLIARYNRVRRPPPVPACVRRVYVLSRVTLGADIAVTSVLLDAAKRRFPSAEICYTGSRKGWELFAADPRIQHTQAPYVRTGTLSERLAAGLALREILAGWDAIVVDPDSRLTQLGLLPVCEEDRYFFFESRSFGGDGGDSLPVLAARWAEQTFGVSGARAYVAPTADSEALAHNGVRRELAPDLDCSARRTLCAQDGQADITVSFGVGENPAKRIADPFETELLRSLRASGWTVLIDKGGSEEESARVERAVADSGPSEGRVETWQGAFAPFAAAIAASRLYIGYDSAGQHAAAAAGVPLVAIFAGFPTERMFERWRPDGAGAIRIVRADDPEPYKVLEATLAAVRELLP